MIDHKWINIDADIIQILYIYKLENSHKDTTFYTLYFYFQDWRKSYTTLKSIKVLRCFLNTVQIWCNEYSSLEDWSINEEQFTKNYLLLIIPTLSSVYNLYEFRCKLLSDHRVRSILRVSVVVVNTLEQIQDRYTNFVWNTTFYLKAVKINNHWSNKISFFSV